MSNSKQKSSSNPFADSGSKMVLQVPTQIKVKLVNSEALSGLKTWSALCSFFSNLAVGFWVWFCQNSNTHINNFLLVASIILTIITIVFLYLSFGSNKKLKQDTSEINYAPVE